MIVEILMMIVTRDADPFISIWQGGRPLRPSLPAWLRSLWDLPTLPLWKAPSVSSFSSPLSFSSSFAGSKVGRCISKICTSTTAKGSYPCQLFRSPTQGVWKIAINSRPSSSTLYQSIWNICEGDCSFESGLHPTIEIDTRTEPGCLCLSSKCKVWLFSFSLYIVMIMIMTTLRITVFVVFLTLATFLNLFLGLVRYMFAITIMIIILTFKLVALLCQQLPPLGSPCHMDTALHPGHHHHHYDYHHQHHHHQIVSRVVSSTQWRQKSSQQRSQCTSTPWFGNNHDLAWFADNQYNG